MINMSQYASRTGRLPKVLSINDDVADRYERMRLSGAGTLRRIYYDVLVRQFVALDRNMFDRFDAVHVVSEEERRKILSRRQASNLVVISVSVMVASEAGDTADRTGVSNAEGSPTLFTAGNLFEGNSCIPLLEFCTAGMSKLRRRWPGTSLTIVARFVPRNMVERLTGCQGVTLLGETDRYRELLARAHVALFLDTVGSGIKTRVVEALAAGKAVVGTECAFEGIPVRNGSEGFIVRNGTEASEVVCRLLESKDVRLEMGKRARAFASDRYSFEVGAKKWEALYGELIARRKQSGFGCEG
jgi:glycosyltransferase involved in cell wall biosynthesis